MIGGVLSALAIVWLVVFFGTWAVQAAAVLAVVTWRACFVAARVALPVLVLAAFGLMWLIAPGPASRACREASRP